MVRWYVSFRRPRFLCPVLMFSSTCLGVMPVWVFCCLGVLPVWVFYMFGCSACLGVLPVWVFYLFGCSACLGVLHGV